MQGRSEGVEKVAEQRSKKQAAERRKVHGREALGCTKSKDRPSYYINSIYENTAPHQPLLIHIIWT
jgi:hypothetical protein